MFLFPHLWLPRQLSCQVEWLGRKATAERLTDSQSDSLKSQRDAHTGVRSQGRWQRDSDRAAKLCCCCSITTAPWEAPALSNTLFASLFIFLFLMLISSLWENVKGRRTNSIFHRRVFRTLVWMSTNQLWCTLRLLPHEWDEMSYF